MTRTITSTRQRRRSFLPGVEALEDRAVPSTFTVLNLTDSGDGSLRQAILDANAAKGADDIVFAPKLHGTITLKSGQLSITDDLTLAGPGADHLAISGNKASRIFEVTGGVTVSMAGLTITQGRLIGSPAEGGGIRNDGSQLTLTQVVMRDNEAVGEPNQSGQGGAIANYRGATLTVTDSLFAYNRAIGGEGIGGGGKRRCNPR